MISRLKQTLPRWAWVSALVVLLMFAGSLQSFIKAFNERTAITESREDAFDTLRPFQRLQREILNVSVVVAGGQTSFTVDDLQLQRDIVASRYFDLNLGKMRTRLSPELLNVLDTSEAQWNDLQAQLDQYQASGLADEAARVALTTDLKSMELTVNNADNIHAIKLDQLDKRLVGTEDKLYEAQVLSIFLLMLSIVLVAAWIILQLRASSHQLARTNETLQQRTIELDQINHELEKANRLKSEFLATMSHELRTPLNSILGYTGLLKMGIRGKTDEEGKESLKAVEASSKHLLGLINDILDIAKIEAGRMELADEPFDLNSLAHDWSSHLKVLADKKGLEFQTSIDDSLPRTLRGDKERLTQIANNLLSNAIKFTDKGQVALQIGRENGSWTIQVTDTGKGIPPDAQEYIFDEFRQVDGNYNRSQGGTGLGLAIVRKLTQAMDGTIQLNSKLGQGSTFLVKLPLKEG